MGCTAYLMDTTVLEQHLTPAKAWRRYVFCIKPSRSCFSPSGSSKTSSASVAWCIVDLRTLESEG